MLATYARTVRLRPRTMNLARKYSGAAPHYHSKVRAFPFAISEHEAIKAMAPYASLACMLKDFVGSVASFFFPNVPGFKPIQPSRIQPIYFPSWIIDAELEAQNLPRSEDKTPATAFLSDSYMPGNAYDPLCKLSLNSEGLKPIDPVPFTKSLLNQHGRDVVCLPYNISPVGLPDLARSASYLEINKAIRLDTSNLKVKFLAAYPILIPLYLAQYQFDYDGKAYSTTAIMEAFNLHGRVIMEQNPIFNDPTAPRNAFTDFVNPRLTNVLSDLEFWNGEPLPFSKVDLLASTAFTQNISFAPATELHKWLDKKLTRSPDTGEALMRHCRLADADMSDPRVREYMPSEVSTNREYLGMGVDMTTLKMLKSGISVTSSSGQPGLDQIPLVQTPEAAQMIDNHLESLERNREKSVPPWAQELFIDDTSTS